VTTAKGRGANRRGPIPVPSVARLPVYYRLLRSMSARDVETVSSLELAEAAGVNAATLRRDLSHLGNFGTPGTGYEVGTLLEMVGKALAMSREWPILIAGAGNLGRALARSRGFSTGGFRVAALVDVDPAQIGTVVAGTRVVHLDDLAAVVEREGISLGVVATPAFAAADIVTRLAAAGVRSILNFAPAVVPAPRDTVVRNVDLAAELQLLAFYASRSMLAELEDAPLEAAPGAGAADVDGAAAAAGPSPGPGGAAR
jgi:redox-sensing transcriptional repressor